MQRVGALVRSHRRSRRRRRAGRVLRVRRGGTKARGGGLGGGAKVAERVVLIIIYHEQIGGVKRVTLILAIRASGRLLAKGGCFMLFIIIRQTKIWS